MNERKIRLALLAVGVLLWTTLSAHMYLSVWEENPPTYKTAEARSEFVMYIRGEVEHPGPYSFQNGDTYEDLILSAGGLTESADASSFDFASPCIDGETLYVEKVKTAKSSSKTKRAKATAIPVVFPIDLNTASQYELCALPGIGETLANRIIEYRNTQGAFTSVEELLNVSGIGKKKLEAILDKIYVN